MVSRTVRGAVAALAVAALAAALMAPLASAHDEIVATSPSGSASTAQKRVAVLFSGPILNGTLRVFGPAGNKVSKGTGGRDPRNVKRLVVALKGGLAVGGYTVKVKWTAADGHHQEDQFGFRLHK